MKHLITAWAICFAMVAAFGRAEGSWQDELSDPVPGRFPSVEPFEAKYSFGWIDVEAASAEVEVDRDGSEIMVRVVGATSGLVRALWRLDAMHEAVIDADTLRPRSINQIEKLRNREIVTKVEFSPDELKRQRQSIPGDEAKWKRLIAPNVFDILGTGMWLRSQNLENGRSYKLVCYPSESPYLIEFKVESREQVFVMGEMRDAVNCSFQIQKIEVDNKRLTDLAPHSKFRSGRLWLSDDEHRIPLRAEADVFIGYVYGELISSSVFNPESN